MIYFDYYSNLIEILFFSISLLPNKMSIYHHPSATNLNEWSFVSPPKNWNSLHFFDAFKNTKLSVAQFLFQIIWAQILHVILEKNTQNQMIIIQQIWLFISYCGEQKDENSKICIRFMILMQFRSTRLVYITDVRFWGKCHVPW